MRFFVRRVASLFFVSLFLTVCNCGWAAESAADEFELAKQLDIYYSIFKELNTYYVEPLNSEQLVTTSIEAMLASLDPYTNYVTEAEVEDLNFLTTGEYAGIGAVVSKHNDSIVIVEPYENSPAQKAGLQIGDVILAINQKPVKSIDVEDVTLLLKGAVNTVVTLTVKRTGVDEPLDLDVTREKIMINPVVYSGMLNDKVAYIKLSQFTKGAAEKFKQALLALKQQAEITELVIDLRNNPGGLLNEAVDLCGLFFSRNQLIVTTKGRVPDLNSVNATDKEPVDTTVRLVVLVNNASASASEIVAGAVQDLDRGLVLGTRTFGKGLVQNIFNRLPYNVSLKVTTGKYYTPSGRCIQAVDYAKNKDQVTAVALEEIPDSLISSFETRNKRVVYDGGGVSPDVFAAPAELSKVTTALINDFLIFDFVSLYAYSHKTPPVLTQFEITDSLFDAFKDFAKVRNFNYETGSDGLYKRLVEQTKKDGYYDSLQSSLDALRLRMAHNIYMDFDKNSKEIKRLLKEEIVLRYYGRKGATEAVLANDPVVQEAITVFQTPNLYADRLKSGIVIEHQHAKK